ncbi:MAG: hypothetical protein ACQEW8_06000 [Actinomycetota bacterium]
MSRSRTLAAEEQALLAGNLALAAIHADAVRTGRAAILAVIDAHEDTNPPDSERFDREVHELQRRSIVDYARRVHGLLPAPEIEQWRERIERLPAAPRNDLLREVGVPGAGLLLDAVEPVPDETPPAVSLDDALARRADRCTCGYAVTRAVPRGLCLVCAMSVLDAWAVEERRLLDRVPALALELEQVFDGVLDRLADLRNAPMDGFSDLSAGIRRRASRQVARINRAHRDAKAQQDAVRWEELASLAVLDPRPFAQRDAKRWERAGWGTARMSAIALDGNDEVKARMASATHSPTGS